MRINVYNYTQIHKNVNSRRTFIFARSTPPAEPPSQSRRRGGACPSRPRQHGMQQRLPRNVSCFPVIASQFSNWRGNPFSHNVTLTLTLRPTARLSHPAVGDGLACPARGGVAILAHLGAMAGISHLDTDCHTSDIGHWFAMTVFFDSLSKKYRNSLPDSAQQQTFCHVS